MMLFEAALDHYQREHLSRVLAPIEAPDAGVEAIREAFARYASASEGWFRGRGCLMCNTAVERGALDPGARRELADYIKDLRDRRGVTVLLLGETGERLEVCVVRPLDLGGARVGPERLDAGGLETIDQARDQGDLRTDDDKVDGLIGDLAIDRLALLAAIHFEFRGRFSALRRHHVRENRIRVAVGCEAVAVRPEGPVR